MECPNNKVVQHVTKASSDELLRKFADSDNDDDAPTSAHHTRNARKSATKRKKKMNKVAMNIINSKDIYGDENNLEMCLMNNNNASSLRVIERKSLLPQHYRTNKRSSSGNFIVKHLRSSHHHFRGVGATDFKSKCLLSAIEKTWSKAVRGASKVFMEKHYNRHRSLIDDIV